MLYAKTAKIEYLTLLEAVRNVRPTLIKTIRAEPRWVCFFALVKQKLTGVALLAAAHLELCCGP